MGQRGFLLTTFTGSQIVLFGPSKNTTFTITDIQNLSVGWDATKSSYVTKRHRNKGIWVEKILSEQLQIYQREFVFIYSMYICIKIISAHQCLTIKIRTVSDQNTPWHRNTSTSLKSSFFFFVWKHFLISFGKETWNQVAKIHRIKRGEKTNYNSR